MIRRAGIHDLKSALSICRECFDADRFGPARLLDWLAAGAVLTVDDAGAGLLRGFVLAERRPAGRWLRYIAVARAFRRRGVGSALLASVRGPAFAWVRAENAASRGMFGAAGWTLAHDPRTRRAGDWCYFTRE